ncbi:MAG: hypothetical protein IPM29_31155 [Planctomycetes bacterium]|nr:hypothetical protein [Planctomycetota bacterium]
MTGRRAPVAGVLVELRGSLRGSPSSSDRFGRALTGAGGRATVEPDAGKLARLGAMVAQVPFEVAADVPLDGVAAVPLEHGPVGNPEIEIVLPPFGAARVSLELPSGQLAAADGGRVYLFWRPLGSDADWHRVGIPSAASAGGVADFAVVPLGMELCFSGSGDERRAASQALAPGPVRPGQRVDVRVRVGAQKPRVVATVIDESGAVRGGAKLSVGIARLRPSEAVLPADPARAPMRWQDADPTGRIRVSFAPTTDPAERLALIVELDDRWVDGGETLRRGAIPIPAGILAGADTDLGSIVLAPIAPARSRARAGAASRTSSAAASATTICPPGATTSSAE